jgi:hypothetical protein
MKVSVCTAAMIDSLIGWRLVPAVVATSSVEVGTHMELNNGLDEPGKSCPANEEALVQAAFVNAPAPPLGWVVPHLEIKMRSAASAFASLWKVVCLAGWFSGAGALPYQSKAPTTAPVLAPTIIPTQAPMRVSVKPTYLRAPISTDQNVPAAACDAKVAAIHAAMDALLPTLSSSSSSSCQALLDVTTRDASHAFAKSSVVWITRHIVECHEQLSVVQVDFAWTGGVVGSRDKQNLLGRNQL